MSIKIPRRRNAVVGVVAELVVGIPEVAIAPIAAVMGVARPIASVTPFSVVIIADPPSAALVGHVSTQVSSLRLRNVVDACGAGGPFVAG